MSECLRCADKEPLALDARHAPSFVAPARPCASSRPWLPPYFISTPNRCIKSEGKTKGAQDWRWGDTAQNVGRPRLATRLLCNSSSILDATPLFSILKSSPAMATCARFPGSLFVTVRTPASRQHQTAGRLRFSLQKRSGNASWEHGQLASLHCESRPCRLTIAGHPQPIPERRPASQNNGRSCPGRSSRPFSDHAAKQRVAIRQTHEEKVSHTRGARCLRHKTRTWLWDSNTAEDDAIATAASSQGCIQAWSNESNAMI